ncbi:amidophosphoribosyltransferase [Marivita sp.]|uniref:amidophosphoribosyltransferase n=1 Tax=Marivita sp. TaxID=2003365 RepID=UPI0025C11C3A|nr:amidophosphoribosyltransferase [Marivita sp.]
MAQNPTPPRVARQATQTTSDLGGALTLLGTFGPQDDPNALLKLRGGKTTTVSRGDRVQGQTVVAIEDGRVALARNGTAHWLEMPAPRS